MFDLDTIGTTAASPDALEQELIGLEAAIGRLRQRQLGLLHQADVDQVATADGARSLGVTQETASQLVSTMRTITPSLNQELADGEISFDRAVVTSRLAAVGADQTTVDRSRGHDLSGVRRITARQRRITPLEDIEAFGAQYLVVQPSLDESFWRLHGQLAGVEGRIVEKAIHDRADQLRGAGPDDPKLSSSQRRALALATIAQDSLEHDGGDITARRPVVTVVVDANLAARTGGEQGAELVGGPRIGPQALDELLCTGLIEWNRQTTDGQIVALGETTATVTPRHRRAVLARDGGCVIDGCSSRDRLEVHHIRERSRDGTHDSSNLVSLCWWHHIVAIHRMGLRIDPASPPFRRRLIQPGADPPGRE